MNSGIFLMIFALIGLSYGAALNYKYSDCILATIDVTADVEIGAKAVQLRNTAMNATGYCNGTSRALDIGLDKNGSLTLYFEEVNGRSILSTVTVNFKDGATPIVASENVDSDLSPSNAWYACDDPVIYKLKGDQAVTVTINSIKVQAFGLVKGEYSENKVSCNATAVPSTTVATDTTEAFTTPDATTQTTQAPTTKTTVLTTTTSKSVTTVTTKTPVTPAPKAQSVNVFVNSTTEVCIVMKLTGTLAIKYVNKTEGNATYIYPIAHVKDSSGQCGNESQSVKLTLENDWILSFTFEKTMKKKSSRRLLADAVTYYMSTVQLKYNEKDLPDSKNTGAKTASSTSKDRNQVDVGQGFSCKSEEVFDMKTASLSTIDFEAEAFRESKTSDFSANPKICVADNSNPSNVVPIVVGVVLALLVLVIIIAYLIGRRRSQSGYQSV